MSSSHIAKSFLQTVIDKIDFTFLKDNNISGNISYSFDNNAARTAGASIVSVCENNKEPFIFHLLCNDISDENIDKFKTIAEKYQTSIKMYFLDTKNMFWQKFQTNLNIPLPTWYRLFSPYLLTDINRLLYLDTDIICTNNITALFSMDMADNIAAVIQDVEPMQTKRNKSLKLGEHKYFNAGVMLINLKKWLANDICGKVFNAIEENKNNLAALDQDALNLVFSKLPHLYLPREYNSIELWKSENVEEKLKATKLIHFASQPKPWSVLWQYEKRPHMENIYMQYENLSPWKGAPLELPKSYHHKRWYAEMLRNNGKIFLSLYWYWQYLKGKYFDK